MPQKKSQTQWHRILGQLFKLSLTSLNVTVSSDFPLLSHPPRGDVLLLRRQQSGWTEAQRAFLPDGVRHTDSQHILIEFKFTESLNEAVLAKTLGYEVLYQEHQELTAQAISSFILSAKTPQSSFLEAHRYKVTDYSGVYRSSTPLLTRVPIIALNGLADTLPNAYVKCFASRAKEREKAFATLEKAGWRGLPEQLWWFLVGLRETTQVKRGAMLNELVITEKDVMALGERWRAKLIETLSIEERLSNLPADEVLSRYEPDEVLSRYEPDEVLSRYEPIARQALLDRIAQCLRVRFKVSTMVFPNIMNRLQLLDMTTLEQLSEVALLVDNIGQFEAHLTEVEQNLKSDR